MPSDAPPVRCTSCMAGMIRVYIVYGRDDRVWGLEEERADHPEVVHPERGSPCRRSDLFSHLAIETILQPIGMGLKITSAVFPNPENCGVLDALYHRRPYVGASHARSWSHLLVHGAILWAFIAKT